MATAVYTTAWKNLVRDAQINGSTCQFLWVAAGTGTTAAANTDTQLGAEVCRVAILTAVAGASAGEAIVTGQIPSAIASGTTFKEFGLFGGPTATSAANSGTLVARYLATQAHTGNTIQAQFDLTNT